MYTIHKDRHSLLSSIIAFALTLLLNNLLAGLSELAISFLSQQGVRRAVALAAASSVPVDMNYSIYQYVYTIHMSRTESAERNVQGMVCTLKHTEL